MIDRVMVMAMQGQRQGSGDVVAGGGMGVGPGVIRGGMGMGVMAGGGLWQVRQPRQDRPDGKAQAQAQAQTCRQ